MWAIVIVLVAVVAFLGWKSMSPVEVPTGTTATTTTTTTQGTGGNTQTLSSRVVIDAPDSGAVVPKTFTVTGKAPGPWYFEASFPIQIRDSNNAVVGRGIATALSDWMTTGDVAFKADITVESYTGNATLVLLKDNPSGLPEHDDSVSMPIVIQ